MDGGRMGKNHFGINYRLQNDIFCLPNGNANKIYVRLGWLVGKMLLHLPTNVWTYMGTPVCLIIPKCIALQLM